MAKQDRRANILNSASINGIDFIEVANAAQTLLRVHFINAVDIKPLQAMPIIGGGEMIPTVPVLPISPADWGLDDTHLTLTLRVAAPGDFSIYSLALKAAALDVFFSSACFSFKAGCPSDVDCAPVQPAASFIEGNAPPIDYLAKDFLSFRQALLDFSTQQYPNWQERSEADFGMMFLEALSAVGDDLSYLQDRIAGEASLSTATQRRSILRHARLVDYEAGTTLSASAALQFEVVPGTAFIDAGVAVNAQGPDGSPIQFETGLGLADQSKTPVNSAWNRAANIAGYWLDDSAKCLPTGATAMRVRGHGHLFKPGQSLLIETAAAEPLEPPLAQLVQLLPAGDPAGPWTQELHDDIFNADYTRIAWTAAGALTQARDLGATQVIGNIVQATQGRRVTETFVVGPAAPGSSAPLAIERAGPSPAAGEVASRPTIKLFTLAAAPVTWLAGQANLRPEILVREGAGSDPWTWTPSLLDAGATEKSFTLDPANYRPLGANSDNSVTRDYAGDGGDTMRFGDSVFGLNPLPAADFSVTYRVGAGALGNVASGAIAQIDPIVAAKSGLLSVKNPFAASGGADAQSLLSIKRLAPQAFRAVMERAVLPQDYAAAAQTLAWVKRAGTSLRWTGSWLTTFTTPEPVASEKIQVGDRIGLIALLNRFRMAGAESYVPDPNYVSIDLVIEICAKANAFAAQVQQATTAALAPVGANAAQAFFAVSRFVFGQPLYRSALEAAIQATNGVNGVTSIQYRLRDHARDFAEMGDSVTVGASQILRCDNDPSRPNNGALLVRVGGGR
jgi:hypothetical protein